MVPEIKISLLVVDDDPLVLEALGRYFVSAEDMEVRATAENGKVALELLQKQDFDVIVADIHMPEMDGTTLLREVNKLEDPPVFVAMTAMDNDETLKEVMSNKAAAYILKLQAGLHFGYRARGRARRHGSHPAVAYPLI